MNLSDEDVKRVLADVCQASDRQCPLLIMKDHNKNLATIGLAKVIIGRNLLAMLDTEDELAAVLAHELSHREADNFDEWSAYMAYGPAHALDIHMRIESRADTGSVDLLRKMGRDPSAMASMLRKIDQPGMDTSDGSRLRNVEQYLARLV